MAQLQRNKKREKGSAGNELEACTGGEGAREAINARARIRENAGKRFLANWKILLGNNM